MLKRNAIFAVWFVCLLMTVASTLLGTFYLLFAVAYGANPAALFTIPFIWFLGVLVAGMVIDKLMGIPSVPPASYPFR